MTNDRDPLADLLADDSGARARAEVAAQRRQRPLLWWDVLLGWAAIALWLGVLAGMALGGAR